MLKKVDFSRTGDVDKVLDTVKALGDAPELDEDLVDLAVDILNTVKLNDPLGPSLLGAVRLGVMLASIPKGSDSNG